MVSVLNPLLLLALKFSTQAVVYIVWPFSSSPSHSCFDSFSIWNSKSSMFSTRPSSQHIYEHMTIVRVSIVCLIDRWIWISVSSVLHFVCCTFFFPLPPPLLAFSSAHYLPNLLPHMQTMCNESLSYLFSTNNSNSDMISIHILEATHMITTQNQYLERLSSLRIPHFEELIS